MHSHCHEYMELKVKGRTLLVVEDDEELKNKIKKYFSAENHVFTASDIDEAVKILEGDGTIDAVVLDLILKNSMGLDLFEVFPALPPVVILTSLGGEENIISGLQSGAADYVVKPCSMTLLETHIALRLQPKADAIKTFGHFYIDQNTRTAKYKNKPIQLTSSEFNILFFLVQHPGEYFTADEIYEKIWCAPSLHQTVIRVHLSSLRRKLKEALPTADIIRTEFNKGYCFTGKAL